MADLNYRPMGFESDVANSQFAGAADPDQFLHKEFYWYEPLDRNKTDEASEKEGRLVRIKGQKTIYIRIMKPGDQTSILETPAREDHKRRFPREWLNFQMAEGLIPNTAAAAGWKVRNWEEMTPDEIHKLEFNRFFTVEQLANASDGQIQGIGMGGEGLRKRAQEALQRKNAVAKAAENTEIEELKKTVAELKAMLTNTPQVANQAGNESVAIPIPPEAPPPARTKYVMTDEHKAKMKAAREARKGK